MNVNGPKFAAYVRQVAAVAKAAHGPGKVIVVAYSMGGLTTRAAASEPGAGRGHLDGHHHRDAEQGQLLVEYFDILPAVCTNAQSALNARPPAGFCAQWTAAGAMSVFNAKIGRLPNPAVRHPAERHRRR